MRLFRGLSVLLGLSVPVVSANAASHTSVSYQGRTITVTGAASQSVTTANDSAVISADGIRIDVDGETLTMDGRTAQLGDFEAMAVTIADGVARITVDGREVLEP
jgi:hypothetical protein